MKYFIAFMGTVAPILVCFITSMLCLYAFIFNNTMTISGFKLLVVGITFFISSISPFKYGDIYRNYYYENNKQKEK